MPKSSSAIDAERAQLAQGLDGRRPGLQHRLGQSISRHEGGSTTAQQARDPRDEAGRRAAGAARRSPRCAMSGHGLAMPLAALAIAVRITQCRCRGSGATLFGDREELARRHQPASASCQRSSASTATARLPSRLSSGWNTRRSSSRSIAPQALLDQNCAPPSSISWLNSELVAAAPLERNSAVSAGATGLRRRRRAREL